MMIAMTAGCISAQTRVIDGKTWQLWGDDLLAFEQFIRTEPAATADRCSYWNDRVVDVNRSYDLRLLGGPVIGTTSSSDNLKHFVADQRATVCDAMPASPPLRPTARI